MAYRPDPDLEFLSRCSSIELDALLQVIVFDTDGKKRHSEQITNDSRYIKYHPDHEQYWELLAEEVQKYGANSLATILRGGKGVLYKEILFDVCDKVKVKYDKDAPVEEIERKLIEKVAAEAISKLSSDEIKEVSENFKITLTDFTPQALTAVVLSALQGSFYIGNNIAIWIFNSVLAAVTRQAGIVFVGGTLTARVISILTGPIGWTLAGLWTMVDIAGPAYRVTVPSVLIISCLRQLHALLPESISK